MTERLEDRSEAELLQLAIAGNESAFLLLYERLKMPLFRYAFHMTNSQAAAEEILQEVLIFLLKSGRRYKSEQGDLSGFAFGITRNFVRRWKKRERRSEELPGDEELNRVAGTRSGRDDLPDKVIRGQRIEKVRAAIRSLPDRYRQVIILCDLCELTYTDAASRLECPVGTIRSRLNRAHSLLARKLTQTQPELPAAGTEECLI
jgi:RNA polymerase sigma-70 factor, ECF subfamily